jgi:hypothetical protein
MIERERERGGGGGGGGGKYDGTCNFMSFGVFIMEINEGSSL